MVHSRSPRDRLLAGMAESIRQRGFRATTVADVVREARTSRRTFYEHFADREACLLALYDAVGDQLMERVAKAARSAGSWHERVDRALEAYLDELSAQPELARCSLFEIAATGERGAAHVRAINDRAAHALCELADEARAEDPELRPLSLEAATMIIGGLRELIAQALDRGREPSELHAVVSGLVWLLVAGEEPPVVGAQPRRISGSSGSSTS